MEAIIVTNATAEKIAALVVAIQERHGSDDVPPAYLEARKDALEKVEHRMKDRRAPVWDRYRRAVLPG